MHSIKFLVFFSFISLLLISCKKEVEEPVDSHVQNLAPCEIPEEVLEIESIIYGPSVDFPQAKLRITFVNSTLEYAFNKVPGTGMYHMVSFIDTTSQNMVNQMATISDSGSFQVRSAGTEFADVYIENYNHELIISYCDIQNSAPFFYPPWNAYVGNLPSNLRVRMSY